MSDRIRKAAKRKAKLKARATPTPPRYTTPRGGAWGFEWMKCEWCGATYRTDAPLAPLHPNNCSPPSNHWRGLRVETDLRPSRRHEVRPLSNQDAPTRGMADPLDYPGTFPRH